MILRRNYQDSLADAQAGKGSAYLEQQEYEILLEFDLKREKEKNQILEERLKNKETFIQQMKHFQEELTMACKHCQNDLILAQEKIEYLQDIEYRDYIEQIADLKHMLALRTQESKRNSVGREERNAFRGLNTKVLKYRSGRGLSLKNTEKRESMVSSHYGTQREKSAGDKMESQVGKQIQKTANFITNFLQMSQCYLSNLKSEDKLTKKLYRRWKWIEDVVKQWDSLREKSKSFEHFRQSLAEIYKTEKGIGLEIFIELIKNRKEAQ